MIGGRNSPINWWHMPKNTSPGLSEHTLTREIITPADFRELTHAEHHAFGGLAPVMGRPNIKHQTPIEGLWFIGQQSESGGGVFNVLPSSYKVARRIIEG